MSITYFTIFLELSHLITFTGKRRSLAVQATIQKLLEEAKSCVSPIVTLVK